MNKLLDLLDKLPGRVAALAYGVWMSYYLGALVDNIHVMYLARAIERDVPAVYKQFSIVRAVREHNPMLPFGEEVIALLDELEDEL
jgi:hypothetical protein